MDNADRYHWLIDLLSEWYECWNDGGHNPSGDVLDDTANALAGGVHTCHDNCPRTLCTLRRELAAEHERADRLEKELDQIFPVVYEALAFLRNDLIATRVTNAIAILEDGLSRIPHNAPEDDGDG